MFRGGSVVCWPKLCFLISKDILDIWCDVMWCVLIPIIETHTHLRSEGWDKLWRERVTDLIRSVQQTKAFKLGVILPYYTFDNSTVALLRPNRSLFFFFVLFLFLFVCFFVLCFFLLGKKCLSKYCCHAQKHQATQSLVLFPHTSKKARNVQSQRGFFVLTVAY